ncbi:PEP-CTERM sorting domain-containing protein [Massilia phyllosphaerae]|uniref:PEP-CTERM sorting domain-containing protein n=1 Tax=Massilia phyllosphaerae TaxID=3106034 RepID=UPI002B1CC4CC|nr:PEP-CTERM sorting domain-containing protein [Massilia sp. SGZ-792]
MKKLITCALAALSIHASSQANVVYEWQGNNNAAPFNITLRMEFTDAAFEAGAVHVRARPYQFLPNTGLVAFHYSFPGPAQPVSYLPTERPFGEGELLDMDIVFEDDLTLSGTFKAIGIESHVFMDSVGSLFTVTNANSDAGMGWAGCAPWTACSGATGVFRQVPEPGSMALVGLGLLGLARRFRARRGKPPAL